ncbi:hypothetical protein F5H01DRAFT_356907 [Linnemannia elongata]|nr:hypothetical protein F5H01DRAFT_356907 [Linnemannia elongata]
MQDKRILVLVSLATLVANTLADMSSYEKWIRWGIDECNGDPKCWTEQVGHSDENVVRWFCENKSRPEINFFRELCDPDAFWCEYIPPPPPDADLICGYT